MTIRFTEGDKIPADIAGFVEELFTQAILEFQGMVDACKANEPTDVKAKNVVRDLRTIALDLVRERANVETLRKQLAGTVGAGTELDLGAARDEIGRRLACLRAARGD